MEPIERTCLACKVHFYTIFGDEVLCPRCEDERLDLYSEDFDFVEEERNVGQVPDVDSDEDEDSS